MLGRASVQSRSFHVHVSEKSSTQFSPLKSFGSPGCHADQEKDAPELHVHVPSSAASVRPIHMRCAATRAAIVFFTALFSSVVLRTASVPPSVAHARFASA